MNILKTIIENLPQILIAFLVFGVLIFVHELGHFLTAKWSGIKVNEFAMGMGPAIWKHQRGETVYALRIFPIGGYCALEGDDEESSDERAFARAPLYKRVLTLAAGSAMNLLLGLIILSVISMRQPMLGTTTVRGFYEGAATNQWLQVGDQIKKINNHTVRTDNDIFYELTRDRDGVMDFLVARPTADGKTEDVLLKSVTFMMRSYEGTSIIMIDFATEKVESTFLSAVGNSFNWTSSMIKQTWGGFVDLVTGRYGLNQLSGPVGVTAAIGETAKQAAKIGWDSLFALVAFITLNLGVFNLLPLPALDGGRLMFLAIEAVRRKPVNPRYEGLVHGVGFMLLIALVIFVTINDVAKIL